MEKKKAWEILTDDEETKLNNIKGHKIGWRFWKLR
jgi:hypothetical protein